MKKRVLDISDRLEQTQQTYFPFMAEYVKLSDYVLDEIPFMQDCHYKYVVMTHDPISFTDFTVEHYCNPDSIWYMAQEYRDKYDPMRMPDGYIVLAHEYLRTHKKDE